MSNETIVKGHDFGDTLVPYENMWVALHRHEDMIIENAATLLELAAKLCPEELAEVTLMHVMPHISFISRPHAVSVRENR